MAGLLLAGVVYAAVVFVLFPRWTVDDAYITFRYAENLARTGELAWNPGERPVEGYTGVALPVALAGAIRLGIPVEVAAKAVGVAAYAVGAIAFLLLLGRLGVSDTVRGAFGLVYLTTPALFTHATSGLETMLFMAAVVVSLWCAGEGLADGASSVAWDVSTAVALLVAGLVRPEGVALAACLAPAYVFFGTRTRHERVRAASLLTLLFVVPAATYFCWRVGYYGQLLPNTYYAKWHRGFVPDSLYDLTRFAVVSVALPAMAAVAFFVARRQSRAAHPVATAPGTESYGARTHGARAASAIGSFDGRYIRLSTGSGSDRVDCPGHRIVVPALAFVAICVAVYLRSALIMNYSGRFFVPMLPVVLMCVALAVGRMAARPVALVVMGTVLLAAQVLGNVIMLGREASFAASTKSLLEHEHVPVGQFLRAVVPAAEWTVVVVDAGAIPYHSGLKTVDFGGLNDAYLARRFMDRRTPAEVVDYFFLHRPAAAVFTSRVLDRVDGPERAPITSDPRFADYVLVATYCAPGWEAYYELVYLRRDLAEAQASSSTTS